MRSILLTFCLLVGGLAFGQTDFDERLLAKFSEERINQLQKEQPAVIEYWTYYLDNSYLIIDSKESGKEFNADKKLKIKNMNDFNILDLGLTMDRNKSQVFAIAGSEKYLMLLSNSEFVNGFNNSRKQ